MRVAVRTLFSGFDAEDRSRTYGWLDHGQWEAVMRLRAGEPYTYAARAGACSVEWTARPVLYLRTAGKPACSQPTSPLWSR